jgi:hypothetical protein
MNARVRRTALLGFVAATALGLSACGESDDDDAPAPAPGAPLVEFTKSGGVAGIAEGITVNAGGGAVLTLGWKDEAVKRFELTDAELSELEEAVAAADLAAFEVPPESACADCFVYELTTAEGSATYDDAQASGLAEGEVPDAVVALSALLGNLISEHAPDGSA